jgi:hypothetical protein
MLKDRSIYRCVLCGAAIEVPDVAQPRISIEGSGGKPNMRVLLLDGAEIHRCEARITSGPRPRPHRLNDDAGKGR